MKSQNHTGAQKQNQRSSDQGISRMDRLNDQFGNGDMEINNEAYNNPKVVVS